MSHPGMGVMINALSGNRGDAEALRASIGKVIVSAAIADHELVLTLADGSVVRFVDEGQSCCEDRHMSTDDDLAYYAGASFLDAEIREAPNVPHEWGEHEQQFLVVTTSKGAFTVVNHNEHNGYYGGFWIVPSVTPAPEAQS